MAPAELQSLPVFADRADAGRQLGNVLLTRSLADPVVIGLARGGVIVAAEVARVLVAPLDVLVVRKLGLPQHPEVAMGAIAEGGVRILDPEMLRLGGVSGEEVKVVEDRERRTLAERVHALRGDRPIIDVDGRLVVVVDDGLATGATARAAVQAMRRLGATTVVLAVPVASPQALRELSGFDDVVCLGAPAGFLAVGVWYVDFAEVSDEQAAEAVARSRAGSPA